MSIDEKRGVVRTSTFDDTTHGHFDGNSVWLSARVCNASAVAARNASLPGIPGTKSREPSLAGVPSACRLKGCRAPEHTPGPIARAKLGLSIGPIRSVARRSARSCMNCGWLRSSGRLSSKRRPSNHVSQLWPMPFPSRDVPSSSASEPNPSLHVFRRKQDGDGQPSVPNPVSRRNAELDTAASL